MRYLIFIPAHKFYVYIKLSQMPLFQTANFIFQTTTVYFFERIEEVATCEETKKSDRLIARREIAYY